MGSSQSVPTNADAGRQQADQQLIDQLKSLRVREQIHQQEMEHGYIHIDKEKGRVEPYSGSPSLSVAAAKEWEKQLLSDPKNQLALSALLSNPLQSIVMQKVATLSDTQVFNIKIPFEGGPVANQRSSGRCWLFASTNIFRTAIMKKHNLKEFELSQAYVFFWDKLEKANYFLTQIIDTADQDLDSREIQQLLGAPVNDGGQWDMAANLVRKYGLVPQKLYPDSYHAMNSSAMDQVITTKLREDALALRSIVTSEKTPESGVASTKAKMLREVHAMLTLMLGPPPKPDQKFDWEYYDANDKYHKVSKTPLELAQELSAPATVRSLNFNVDSMFSLVNDPRNPYLTHLTVSRLGNIVEGRQISYVNVDMATMKKAAVAMLKAGVPIFFGCDVGKYFNSQSGILDTKMFDYGLAFNISLGMSKAQRMNTGESAVTHAMVLTAVHVEDGKTVRWRIQNSWGEAAGDKGYLVMSDAWMDQFVYQIVVDPSFVDKAVRDVVKQEPTVLPLWDPLGALA